MPGDLHIHFPKWPSAEKVLVDLLPETAAERDRRRQVTQGKTLPIRLPRVLGRALESFYWGPRPSVHGRWVTMVPDENWQWRPPIVAYRQVDDGELERLS